MMMMMIMMSTYCDLHHFAIPRSISKNIATPARSVRPHANTVRSDKQIQSSSKVQDAQCGSSSRVENGEAYFESIKVLIAAPGQYDRALYKMKRLSKNRNCNLKKMETFVKLF